MSDDIILQVDNISKCFKIYANPWHRTREWVSFRKRSYHQPFWSLKNVSFEVRRGEFLGIIGENGAGKSTLLKIITGVLQPTSGIYQLNGKVLSLLELGTDFNLEMSGRENAIRSAELLGFPTGYVQNRLEDIADFSELGEFFNRPMKLYSSGMRARLAFSLFAFLECDVLILDEVLAVGDIFFQQKCYARLEEMRAKQITIILVTHQLAAVQQYCNEVILLHQGEKIYQGEPKEGILKYHQLKRRLLNNLSQAMLQEKISAPLIETSNDFFWPADEVFIPISFPNTNYAQITRYAICNAKGEATVNFLQGEQAYFCCEFRLKENIDVPLVAVQITNKFNVIVHAKASHQHRVRVPYQVNQGDYIRFCRSITLSIAPGQYVLGFALGAIQANDYARLDEIPQAEFKNSIKICDVYEKVAAFFVAPHYYHNHHFHFGLCNLPGDGQIQVIANSK
ncbi:ABC transporter ATP-binding protein [Tolypothrix sp. PCC 7910]|uniref:ABC transporter ATP-binding protein n=1 Tax=Tolypothrix sp. PCC 7910 TaxID=2099387 RepID=UPI00142793CB|nr:ABC transporter ATP-binding protein [Tolypothrix sp. PCC 7910]QIR37168.1 ABC transporter ATP-binding protein [Tolypothrix sp. PCC 7910]